MIHRTQVTGTGGFARTSEPPIHQNSTFAKSAGGPATQAQLEQIAPLQTNEREHPLLAASSSALHKRSAEASSPGHSPEEDGKKRKRWLLLLLLTFTAAFLGFGGLDLLLGGHDREVVAQNNPVVIASAVKVEPTQVVESPVAIPAKTEPTDKTPAQSKITAVDDDRLPEESITPSMIPAHISDVVMPVTQYNITYPEPVAPPAISVRAKTNFVAFEQDVKLSQDPETRVFSMGASSAEIKGSASLSWSTLSGAALFRCKGLEGNKAGSNYVLYYIDENDKAQRMMSFAVASGAELMLIPPRIPSRGVKRVILTLEKSVKTLEGRVLRREEILYSDYKEKAILTKPLK